jgi:hypothetical protein
MAIIGSFSYGSASAVQYSTIEELLSQLPDNTDNIIVAQDIRDAVYTLWERISTFGTSSVFFQNTNPTLIDIGGIPAGTNFQNPTDMQSMWNQLLYPYTSHTSELSLIPNTREYGNSIALSNDGINLNWEVIRNSDPILSIVVDGQSFIATGNSQSGIKATTGTHSWNTSILSQNQTFTMSSTDGTTNVVSNSTLTWMNNVYWGSIDLSSIGNPNLTTNPSLVTQVAILCTDSAITGLTGAGIISGRKLSTTKNATYNGINGNGNYLVFAWPSSVLDALTPVFEVNGLINTAFTRVRTASPLVNQYGFITNYEVWISNTIQNSPLNITIS